VISDNGFPLGQIMLIALQWLFFCGHWHFYAPSGRTFISMGCCY